MIYTIINSQNELDAIINKLWWNNLSFLKEDGLKIYGYFHKEGKDKYDSGEYYFVYGQTLFPNECKPINNETIFSKLKRYGSSGKYVGLLDCNNNIIIPNQFHSIEHIGGDLFRVEKNNLYGVIDLYKGTICPLVYNNVLKMSEYTFGVVKNGKIGFMDCLGKLVIPLIYDYCESDDNCFFNGKVLVNLEKDDHTEEFEIDHYNNIVSKINFIYPENNNYEDQDYSGPIVDYDILDAYEGDASNMWNTD